VPLTPELAVVQDADRLDAIGAVGTLCCPARSSGAKLVCLREFTDRPNHLAAGIGRTFTYGGARNRPMYDPEHPPIEVGGSCGQHLHCQLHGGWLSLVVRYVL